MTVPFMRAYTELLVQTCHRRGAHAIGGMAAFIPSRRDPEVNEIALAQVREDKEREAGDGFDGTLGGAPRPGAGRAWRCSTRCSATRPNQLDRLREDVRRRRPRSCSTSQPRRARSPKRACARTSTSASSYIAAWLQGDGAAAIDNLMEDAATAEISRSQIWQWVHHGRVERADVDRIVAEVMAELPDEPVYSEARDVFEKVALRDVFVDFLTLTAYAQLLGHPVHEAGRSSV